MNAKILLKAITITMLVVLIFLIVILISFLNLSALFDFILSTSTIAIILRGFISIVIIASIAILYSKYLAEHKIATIVNDIDFKNNYTKHAWETYLYKIYPDQSAYYDFHVYPTEQEDIVLIKRVLENSNAKKTKS